MKSTTRLPITSKQEPRPIPPAGRCSTESPGKGVVSSGARSDRSSAFRDSSMGCLSKKSNDENSPHLAEIGLQPGDRRIAWLARGVVDVLFR